MSVLTATELYTYNGQNDKFYVTYILPHYKKEKEDTPECFRICTVGLVLCLTFNHLPGKMPPRNVISYLGLWKLGNTSTCSRIIVLQINVQLVLPQTLSGGCRQVAKMAVT